MISKQHILRMNSCSDDKAKGYVMRRCDEGATLELLSDDTSEQLSEFFKMFGDPNRIKILYLLRDKQVCVNHLADILSMSPSAVSHQLRLLRQMRLITPQKVGKKTYYSLADGHVESIISIGIKHLNHD